MSNSLAIAATTRTLQTVLLSSITADPDLNDTTVTTLPLDKARGNNNNNQLNLFLYQIARNAAWSNRDIPQQVKPGETGVPPLALNLFYLVTAYGRDGDATQPFGHELLGKAMSTLHDHCILGPDDIRNATSGSLPRSDLDRQIERIRITFQPLTLEEISKLWTGFATQYRLSAAYEVAVALIESTRPARTPLPALTRGRADEGPRAQGDLTPPFPGLDSLTLANRQSSARLGDPIVLDGHHLDGTNVSVVFNHPLWTTPVDIAVPAGPDATATRVVVTIPNQPQIWPAGIYTVQVLVQRPGDSFRRSTNQLPFSLAPAFTIAPASAPAGAITYTLTTSPEVRPEQRATLLLGSQEVMADPHAAQTSTLKFQAAGITPGDYFVRLRVDGVDSLLVDKTVTPPVFDPAQKVTVT
jgi:Pvc16 N-terminal domain